MISRGYFGKVYIGDKTTVQEFEQAITDSGAWKRHADALTELNFCKKMYRRGVRRDKVKSLQIRYGTALREFLHTRSELKNVISEVARVFRVTGFDAPAGWFVKFINKLFYGNA